MIRQPCQNNWVLQRKVPSHLLGSSTFPDLSGALNRVKTQHIALLDALRYSKKRQLYDILEHK
jgi:hypothetical protein